MYPYISITYLLLIYYIPPTIYSYHYVSCIYQNQTLYIHQNNKNHRKEQFAMNEVKDKKGEFRCPETFKETYTNYCKKNNLNISEFIRDAITEKIERETSNTGLSPKANILLINKQHNITLAFSDVLPKE